MHQPGGSERAQCTDPAYSLNSNSLFFFFFFFFFWLGPAAEDSDVAFDLIDSLARGNVMAPRVGAVGTKRNLDEERHQRFADMVTQDEGSKLCYALVMPMNRKWWTRVWVLQEAAAATSVEFVCGRHSVQYKQLLGAVRLVDYSPEVERGLLKYRMQISYGSHQNMRNALEMIFYRQWRRQTQLSRRDAGMDVFSCLEMSQSMEAGDDRDKVFAMLGLSSDALSMILVPDYDKPVADVYKDFVTAHVRIKENLDIIHFEKMRVRKIYTPELGPRLQCCGGSSMASKYDSR